MEDTTRQALRALPAVEELLNHAAAARLLEKYPRTQVVEAVRSALEAARLQILAAAGGDDAGTAGTTAPGDIAAPAGPAVPGGLAAPAGLTPTPEDLLTRAAVLLEEWALPGLRPVLNLTGVVIHTNLGRAPLSEAAVEQVVQVARSYSNLEYDVEAGARGSRESHVEDLLTRLTGAEAGFAVNNNAGAVLLLLMALASGREVLVSRGQLVEIGGSFRLPDIMRAGGVRLVEVGTTNRTRVEDYEAAITAETALLLRVHTSNYRIMGFTEEADLGELVGLGRSRGVIVADDLGSGALHDLDAFRGEPTVAASLRAGVDVVCFSGDKLLGGPQAGILVGRREIIERLRKHPVARALRLDKMTLAALEATLRAYQDPERARRDIPVVRSLTRTSAETVALAGRLLAAIDRRSAGGFILEVEESSARAGGGSMPLTEVPSHAVRIRFPELPIDGGAPGGTARPAGAAGGPGGSGGEAAAPTGATPTVAALENALRHAPTPVIARVSQDSLHLDVLALDERDLDAVADSVAWAIDRVTRPSDEAAPASDVARPA
jgi:L-seryl-tRNA(Ser) seleniumtransferase